MRLLCRPYHQSISHKAMYDNRDRVISWMESNGLGDSIEYEFPFASKFTVDIDDDVLAIKFKFEFMDYYQVTDADISPV